MPDRYFVTGPVPDGERWWDVRDRQHPHMPNGEVASFHADFVPGAEFKARDLCESLNAQQPPQKEQPK